MKPWKSHRSPRLPVRSIAALSLALYLITCTAVPSAADPAVEPPQKPGTPYLAGEQLTYVISWSDVFSAGTATMEVRPEKAADGRELIRFVSSAASIGMVDKFYRVRDRIESLYDPRAAQSIAYKLQQNHGKKKKQRELQFDHERKAVTYLSDGNKEVVDMQGHVHDALSSLYFLRSVDKFVVGKSIVISIHDSGKNWDVEVQVLGKERIKTPVGQFDTVKVRTFPKYEGVFMHKGEILMWLTDDARRVPVLMKSVITIGSIMATLTAMHPGERTL